MFRLVVPGSCATFALLLLAPGINAQRELASFRVGKHTSVVVSEVAISPNGKQVAALVCGDGNEDEKADQVRVWDLKTKKEVARLHPRWKGGHRGRLFAFTPDGKQLVCSSEEDIYVFDLIAKRLSRAFKPKSVKSTYAALTPDGKTVVCAADKVGLYDLATGKELAVMQSPPAGRQLTISANGAVLAVSHLKGEVSLYDLKARKPLPELPKFDRPGRWRIALSPDGKRLAASESTYDNRTIDLKTREVLYKCSYARDKISHGAEALAFTPDGKRIVSAGRGTGTGVIIWGPKSGKVIGGKEDNSAWLTCMALSKDGRTVVVGYQTVTVYDVRDKKTDPEPGKP